MLGDNDDIFVAVTNKDFYDQMVKLNVNVSTLDSNVNTLVSKVDNNDEAKRDHESRIRVLERWMWAIPVTLLATFSMLVVEVLKLLNK